MIAVVAIILGASIFIMQRYFLGSGYLGAVGEVYLPENNQEKEPTGRISIVEDSHVVRTLKYGKAVMFTTTDNFAPALYEQSSHNNALQPSMCPNVFRINTLNPSPCSYAGTANGAAVYVIHRDMAMSGFEGFTRRGDTFISALFIDGQPDSAVDYFNSLRLTQNTQVAQTLAANKTVAAHHNLGLPAKVEPTN